MAQASSGACAGDLIIPEGGRLRCTTAAQLTYTFAGRWREQREQRRRRRRISFDARSATGSSGNPNILAAHAALCDLDWRVYISDQSAPVNPFAFISHATADNVRFALPLEAALRERGIRTFIDQRDILVGQNFVDRIFDYGIGTADFVIIILSKNTPESAFVHKELTTAVVRTINGRIKAVLPVLLDGVQPPITLIDVNHVRGDEGSVDAVADTLRDAIFGRAEATVAAPPAYIDIPLHRLHALTPDDERVFAFIANIYLDAPRWHPSVSTNEIISTAAIYGMSQELVLESLAILKHEFYIANEHYEGGTRAPYAVDPSSYGLQRFLETYRPRERARALRCIVAAVVNEEIELEGIIEGKGLTEAFAIAILDELKNRQLLNYEMYSEGSVVRGTPMLKRFLRDLDHDKEN